MRANWDLKAALIVLALAIAAFGSMSASADTQPR